MLRSIYSGVSGLRTHQTKMDVIGNNIANINTVGYKRQYVTFQEVFSQMISGASAPQGGRGGTNPQQIGLGVNIGSINTIHTQGAAQRTDNPEDLMIDGEGFFVVTADTNYENRFYTRAGNFTLDKEGNLVTPDGYKVLGYKYDEDGELTSEASPIQIRRSETVAPTATTGIEFRGNLDSRGEAHTADTIIKDSLGNSYMVSFEFKKKQTEENEQDGNSDFTTWTVSVKRITDLATGNYVDYTEEAEGNGQDGQGTTQQDPPRIGEKAQLELKFDKKGNLVGIGNHDLTDEDATAFKIELTNLKDIRFNKDKDGKDLDEAVGPSGNFEDILIIDSENKETYDELTQYANDMDVKPYYLNGNSSGKLEGYAIDTSGTVVGIFSNGEQKALAQIMLAKFDNPMGLQKMGGNLFIESRNSGEPQYGLAGSSGYGTIAPGTLEMSNVDLSLEFTEMITTQRGFQANSRIITTSDEMLQELVNLKR